MERANFQEVLRAAMNKIEDKEIKVQNGIRKPESPHKENNVSSYIDSLFEGRELEGRDASYQIPGDVEYRAIISLAEAFSKSYKTGNVEERKARGKELAIKILHNPSQLLSEYDQTVIDAHKERVWYVKNMLIEAILAQIKGNEERQY